MDHLTRTPFGRPVTAGLLATQQLARAAVSVPEHDKWQLFRAICTARTHIGVTDRDLTVLNALLSFYPGNMLKEDAGLVVFPSNRALSERAHGMAESTLRRHLASLVRAGVILRHDSPNGKRYAARGPSGEVERAFGFDLRPLLVRATEFTQAADQVTAEMRALKQQREACVLMLRDATQLTAFAQVEGHSYDWTSVNERLLITRKALRRKLSGSDIEVLSAELRDVLAEVETVLEDIKTEEMNGKDSQDERHYQNSKPDLYEFEPCLERAKGAEAPTLNRTPKLPLAVVLKACPDLQSYLGEDVRHWRDLVNAASFLRGMMGISPDAWEEARRVMGAEAAAITVACMLQRMDQINSPGGYLRSLTQKAGQGAFSPAPMVMALLNGANRVAA